jgi:hypothetical protein
MMTKTPPLSTEDPRRLRDLLARSCELAERHTVTSVVVGLSAREGDLLIPEIIDFVESALRVEDAVFRMTRERAVLFLTDANQTQAQQILTRVLSDFRERFATASAPNVELGFYEVRPEARGVGLKDVLPAVFRERSRIERPPTTH